LIQIESVLRDIEGIEMVYLNEADVIRHRLVKDIIGAYEKIDSKVETEKS
jgi:phosphate starvation-inducible PhoH-like protein